MSASMEPLVSVIMPVHDSDRYLADSIGSALGQTESDLELIIVDDASTDGSPAIIDKAASFDGRVEPVRLEDNVGVARSRNLALSRARGRYVAFLDSDDVWEPDKLAKQLGLMRRMGLPICASAYRLQVEGGRGDWVFHVPPLIRYEDMLRANYIGCSTALVRRDLVPDQLFDPALVHEDYGAWLLLMKGGACACGIDEPLATYRVRRGSRSSNKVRAAWGRWQALKRCTDEPLVRRLGFFASYAVAALKKYGVRHGS